MLHITPWNSPLWNWLHLPGLHWIDWRRAAQKAPQEQNCRIHLAFHCAYRRFAQAQPTWVARRFDDQFLRQAMASALRARRTAGSTHSWPTAMSLATAWDDQFGALAPNEAVRSCRLADALLIATHFLTLFERELSQVAAESVSIDGSQP